MDGDLLEIIRTANREFQEFIAQVSQSGDRQAETKAAMHRLARVDLRLKHLSKCFASSPQDLLKSTDAPDVVGKYRENLKTLKGLLENLQSSLLSEKARLESARNNMQAASAWATSVRELA